MAFNQADEGREVPVCGAWMQPFEVGVVGLDVGRAHVFHRLTPQHRRHRADDGKSLALRRVSGFAAGKPLLVTLGKRRAAKAGQRQEVGTRWHRVVARGEPAGNLREGLCEAQQFDVDGADHLQRRFARPRSKQAPVVRARDEQGLGRGSRVIGYHERPQGLRKVVACPLESRHPLWRRAMRAQPPVEFVKCFRPDGCGEPAGNLVVDVQSGPLWVGFANEDGPGSLLGGQPRRREELP